MEGAARLKVSGGKMVSVKLRYFDTIESIEILGDFFLYPESSLAKIEKGLLGIHIDASQNEIAARIAEILKDNGIELIGATPEAIAQVIKLAVKK